MKHLFPKLGLSQKLQRFLGIRSLEQWLRRDLEQMRCQLGRIELRQLEKLASSDLRDYEFQVFSQWGEDGIIQHLLRQIPILNPAFIEFGVENYQEANTRFLLHNNNWEGVVIDGSADNIRQIQNDLISARHSLTPVCSFITRDNINQIIRDAGLAGDIGLLSIDIDGVDYWVWETLDVVSPRIIICEYNSLFGAEAKISVPYDPGFSRYAKHPSGLYFGASAAALIELGHRKGYACVGGNSQGCNLFFVRQDVLGSLPVQTAVQAYARCKFRQSRDAAGKFTRQDFAASQAMIAALPVVDVASGSPLSIGEILRAAKPQGDHA